MIVDNDEM